MKLVPDRPSEGGPSNERNPYVAARAALAVALLVGAYAAVELSDPSGIAAGASLAGLLVGFHQAAAWGTEATNRAIDHYHTRRYEI